MNVKSSKDLDLNGTLVKNWCLKEGLGQVNSLTDSRRAEPKKKKKVLLDLKEGKHRSTMYHSKVWRREVRFVLTS